MADRHPDVYEVGNRIHDVREAKGFSQKVLSERMRETMTANAVSRYELGEREMRISTLFQFADALKVSPNELMPERFHHGEVMLDDEMLQMLELYRSLNGENRKQLIKQAKMLKREEEDPVE